MKRLLYKIKNIFTCEHPQTMPMDVRVKDGKQVYAKYMCLKCGDMIEKGEKPISLVE